MSLEKQKGKGIKNLFCEHGSHKSMKQISVHGKAKLFNRFSLHFVQVFAIFSCIDPFPEMILQLFLIFPGISSW